MKAGDLVRNPRSAHPELVGTIATGKVFQSRIGVIWPTSNGQVSLEPVMHLEVIDEER